MRHVGCCASSAAWDQRRWRWPRRCCSRPRARCGSRSASTTPASPCKSSVVRAVRLRRSCRRRSPAAAARRPHPRCAARPRPHPVLPVRPRVAPAAADDRRRPAAVAASRCRCSPRAAHDAAAAALRRRAQLRALVRDGRALRLRRPALRRRRRSAARPGRDYVLNSHQLFHTLTVVAALLQHRLGGGVRAGRRPPSSTSRSPSSDACRDEESEARPRTIRPHREVGVRRSVSVCRLL